MASPLPPAQSPAPTQLQVMYVTKYGTHFQGLNLRTWIAGADLGSVPRWSDDNPVNVLDMLNALILLESAVLDETASFKLCKLYTKATPESDSILRAVVSLDQDGTSVAAGWDEAVQLSINGKDVDGYPLKLVLLDVLTANNFSKLWTSDISPAVQAIWAEFQDENNGWMSRANHRPGALISQTATLNEKLRRSYRLT